MPTPDGHIGSRDLCSGAVIERTIADGGVSSLKISATLQSDNYASGSAGWIIDRVTGSVEFQDGVFRGSLSANDIDTGYIDASVIEVRNLDADEITTGALSADRIATTSLNADNISSGTLSADYISGGTISGNIIDGGTISGNDVNITNLDADNITSGTISATYISVSSLSALAGDTGALDVTGDLIMNGGTFKTASSGERVEMDNTDSAFVRLYSSSGQVAEIGYKSSWGAMVLNASAALDVYSSSGLSLVGSTGTTIGSTTGRSVSITHQSGYSTTIYNGSTRQFAVTQGVVLYYNNSTKLASVSGGVDVTGDLDVSGIVYCNEVSADGGSLGDASYYFGTDSNTGIYQIAENYMGVQAGGHLIQQWGLGGDKDIYLYGLPSAATNYVRYNGTTGELGYSSSTLRIKKNIVPLEIGLTDRLRPSWFEYRPNDEIEPVEESENEFQSSQFRVAAADVGTVHAGLIAEWTAEVASEFGIYNDGDPVPVNYEVEAVLAAVVADLQDARRRIRELENA